MKRPRVVVIANPAAGPSWRRRPPESIVARIETMLGRQHADGYVKLTAGPGHARTLAREGLESGADLVVAWGGDGTINEVASALIHSRAALGIVPMGSGNGLAREIAVPRGHEEALEAALTGMERTIDAGELNGRVFFNAAGVGFDAHVASTFASSAGHARGFASYASITVRELFRYAPGTYVVSPKDGPIRTYRALLISVANTRQWGNGARIAPAALMDDERLDLVIVPALPPAVVLANSWRLFAGSLAGWSAVESRQVHATSIRCTPPAPAHVDGELFSRDRCFLRMLDCGQKRDSVSMVDCRLTRKTSPVAPSPRSWVNIRLILSMVNWRMNQPEKTLSR
ncbi:MAG: diacylglycerol kinase family protein [Vicinamibacterales bacterium]